MPPTIVTGMQATAGPYGLNADQLEVDMMESIFQYDPPGNPVVTVVTKRAQVRRARAKEVKHLEDDIIPDFDQANGSIGSGVTALVVDNPTYHRVGDILKVVATGETVRVQGVNTGTSTLTIERSWGATAAATIPDNAWLLRLGAAEPEGDLPPVAKSTITVTKTNYLQIMKDTVHVTKTLENVALYGGPERVRQRRKKAEEHARKWEQVLLHGEKREYLGGDYPIRSAGGLDEHISTNVLAAPNGVITEGQFRDFVGDVMRYSVRGRKRKGLLASRELISMIDSWGSNKVQTNVGASQTYGFGVTTYVSSFGTLDIISHPLLENGYAGYGYVIDWDGIWYRPGRRTTLNTNVQQNGEDAFKDEYLTEATYSFALEKAFGKITGVGA